MKTIGLSLSFPSQLHASFLREKGRVFGSIPILPLPFVYMLIILPEFQQYHEAFKNTYQLNV
jgi:hypothetical protein